MLIFKFVYGSLFIYLLNDYLQRYHIDFYKEYSFIIISLIIRLYSKIEIQYNKYKYLFSTTSSSETDETNNDKIYFLQNGKIHNSVSVVNEALFNKNMYVYSKLFTKEVKENEPKETYFLKKILKTFPNAALTIEETSIQFILVELIIGENFYNVKLKDDKFFVKDKTKSYSYYIVDNVLDKTFFMYYFNTHTDYEIDFDKEEKIIARIIDHNVVTIELDLHNFENIKFTKDDYLIQKTDMIII